MTRRGAAAIGLLAAALSMTGAAQRPPAQKTSLTGGIQVARTYDAVMDARFSAVPALLADTCPPAPREVCQLLGVVSSWWQIQLDPHDRRQDATFEKDVQAAIDAMERWTEREPRRAWRCRRYALEWRRHV